MGGGLVLNLRGLGGRVMRRVRRGRGPMRLGVMVLGRRHRYFLRLAPDGGTTRLVGRAKTAGLGRFA